MSERWIASVAGSCLLAGLLGVASAGPVRLGLLYTEHTPGKPATSGSPVLSGGLVQASSHGVLLRLDNGHVLRLQANTAALFDGGTDGRVAVTVLSGRVAAVDGGGDLLLAGHNSRFTLGPTDLDGAIAERRLLALDLERVRRPESGDHSAAAAR
jgi:hypothetical protein